MYCGKCGTKLPEEANFCLKCGTSRKGDVSSAEPRYEFCEIVYTVASKSLLSCYLLFWAKAVGSKGSYDAGKSNQFSGNFPMAHVNHHVNPHNSLINKLVGDGWEPTGDRGEQWYSLRFRRLLKE